MLINNENYCCGADKQDNGVETVQNLAKCPFFGQSTIEIEEWEKICPHFVFLESSYNGYEYIRPGFAVAFWEMKANGNEEEKASLQQPSPAFLEDQGCVQLYCCDVNGDNPLTYGFATEDFLRFVTLPPTKKNCARRS